MGSTGGSTAGPQPAHPPAFLGAWSGEGRERRLRLAETLRRRRREVESLRAFIGFDGFVDEIIRVVATRHGPGQFTPMEKISELAERVGAAAGLSTNLELVVERTKPGGNAPIMALALARLGVRTTLVGCTGHPGLHPVFQPLVDAGVEVIPLGPPAHTDALEFQDGKLMLGKLGPLHNVTWETVQQAVGEARLRALARECHLVAQLNWTMLPHLSGIWEGWAASVAGGARGIFFVDFCDPEKRPLDHLQEGLATLGRVAQRQPVYLGTNLREALALRRAMLAGGDGPTDRPAEAAAQAVPAGALAAELGPMLAARGIQGILIHPVRDAAGWRQTPEGPETAWVEGAYAPRPKLTTGAGDNFNAGAALGLCLQLPLADVLLLGKAVAGYYVRHGESPAWPGLVSFLEAWGGTEI